MFALAAVAACANWYAVERDSTRVEYVAKPATTALLIAAAVVGGATRWADAALALCLAGDVFLMLPREQFVAGLASFLVGHVLFIAAFLQQNTDHPLWPLTAVVAVGALSVSAGAVLRGATAEDHRLRAPVVAYMGVIGAMMLASAWTGSWIAIAGAATFMLSDSILARNRFVAPIPHGRLAIMVTYHAALALIVLGLTR